MTPTPARPDTAALPTPAGAPRPDLYGPIHKALRLLMTDTLARTGRLDTTDPTDTGATLDQLDTLLAACASHLAKENQYVHAALEARQPGASRATAGEHRAHQETLALLQAESDALRLRPTPAVAERLYRHLAHFVAENLEHMHAEESQLGPLLWTLCTDDELQAIEARIRAALSPEETNTVLRWMLPALRPAERHAMLAALRAELPGAAFDGVLAIASQALDEVAWARLAGALGLDAHPGRALATGVAA